MGTELAPRKVVSALFALVTLALVPETRLWFIDRASTTPNTSFSRSSTRSSPR